MIGFRSSDQNGPPVPDLPGVPASIATRVLSRLFVFTIKPNKVAKHIPGFIRYNFIPFTLQSAKPSLSTVIADVAFFEGSNLSAEFLNDVISGSDTVPEGYSSSLSQQFNEWLDSQLDSSALPPGYLRVSEVQMADGTTRVVVQATQSTDP
jgi:hypothetical protein